MDISVLFLSFGIGISCAYSSSSMSLEQIPESQAVYLDQPVILKCTVTHSDTSQRYSVLFSKNENIISENCTAYKPEKYQIVCSSSKKTKIYELHIKSVTWEDQGRWSCLWSANSSSIFLTVYALPEMLPIRVTGFWLPAPANDAYENANIKPGLAPSDFNSPYYQSSLPDTSVPLAYGLGTRTNPYDLRSGFVLHLTCATGCGYPKRNISWSTRNSTDVQVKTIKSETLIDFASCQEASTRAMTTSTSELTIRCDLMSLIGLNRVQCSASPDDLLSKHVYLLCPGGEKPLALTTGEKIGLSVGALIALTLLIFSCVVLRQRTKEVLSVSKGQRI